MKKIISLILCVMMTVLLIAGCGSGSSDEGTEATTEKAAESTTTAATTTTAETTEKHFDGYTGIVNPLTGRADYAEDSVGHRPAAVTVNNVPEAMPQYGVAQADIIFEMPVEGMQTRMVAIYPDYAKLPWICSIRSYRYYFPAMALGFDAFYIHWGEDVTMMDYYYDLGMDAFDGLAEGRMFYRDQDRLSRGYAIEHTSQFDGPDFKNVVEEQERRTELAEEYRGNVFNFTDSETLVEPDGEDCSGVEIYFGGQQAGLYYDSKSGTYMKTNCGYDQVDYVTGTQLAFTNVFILETDIWTRDEIGHKGFDWSGGNDSYAFYMSAGKVQQIHWVKQSEYSRLRFYDLDWNELEINQGKTYIAFAPYDACEFAD